MYKSCLEPSKSKQIRLPRNHHIVYSDYLRFFEKRNNISVILMGDESKMVYSTNLRIKIDSLYNDEVAYLPVNLPLSKNTGLYLDKERKRSHHKEISITPVSYISNQENIEIAKDILSLGIKNLSINHKIRGATLDVDFINKYGDVNLRKLIYGNFNRNKEIVVLYDVKRGLIFKHP